MRIRPIGRHASGRIAQLHRGLRHRRPRGSRRPAASRNHCGTGPQRQEGQKKQFMRNAENPHARRPLKILRFHGNGHLSLDRGMEHKTFPSWRYLLVLRCSNATHVITFTKTELLRPLSLVGTRDSGSIRTAKSCTRRAYHPFVACQLQLLRHMRPTIGVHVIQHVVGLNFCQQTT